MSYCTTCIKIGASHLHFVAQQVRDMGVSIELSLDCSNKKECAKSYGPVILVGYWKQHARTSFVIVM